jgi:AmpD protein
VSNSVIPEALSWRDRDSGLLAGVRYIPSPNFDERPVDKTISLLVIHAISLPPEQFDGDGVIRLFTNSLDPAEHPYYREIERLRVSSHFFIRRDGETIQFVPCNRRAWHAGVSVWCGQERCNDFSVGIELEGSDTVPFESAQYEMLRRLIAVLRLRYPIVDVVGHSDIASGRKTDPGPHFDWTKIY